MRRNTAIEDALATAEMYAERADFLLFDFIDRWFQTIEPSKELLFDVEKRYNIVCAHLQSLSDAVCSCLVYLQAAIGDDSRAVKYFLSEGQEIEEDIKAKREE